MQQQNPHNPQQPSTAPARPMMPPQGMPQGVPMPQGAPLPPQQGWRGRWLRRLGNPNAQPGAKNIWPRWLSQYAVVAYVLALIAVSFLYSAYMLPWYYMLSGVIAVFVFFLYGRHVAVKTTIEMVRAPRNFEKRIFFIAIIPRVVYVVLLYWIFLANYGDAFGFENADPLYYDNLGQLVAQMISRGDYHFYDAISKWSGNDDIADMGYGIYVGFIYWLTDNSIVTVRLLKCVWSSLTVVLLYRLVKRNFGDRTARIAAIFCALWPNFWYYCTTHLKETEMVFLSVLYIEQADQMLRSRQFTAWKVIPVLLIAAILFAFRTPLGMVALLALVFSIVMSSSKVVTWGKRIIVGVLAVLLVGVIAGNRLEERAQDLIESQTRQQESGIKWYGTRKDASGHQQSFAKYAGTAVFAPMIFTLPFPSLSRPFEGQDQQQLQNGGNFVKNIMSGLTIFALFVLLLSGRWREQLLPLSFMAGYLAVLALSSFAHSERFHQPVMPFEFMFAAYGLSVVVTKHKYKRWFTYWCAIMFVAAIAWNWFKLKGRGMI